MAFDAQIKHWPTISAFTAYLQGAPRPRFVKRLTNHNTYKPNELTWLGHKSMVSMMATYIAKGWTSGPHLYLAADASRAADCGIWQLTPLSHPGTHAGLCNADSLGIESVGDFDRAPPSADQYTLLLAINRAILTAWGMSPESVNVHRDCMPGRTCPGKYVTSAQIRADLHKPAPPIPPPSRPYRVIGLPVYQRADHTGALWGHLAGGEPVVIDDTSNGHLADGRGFVDLKGLLPL